MQVQTNHKLDDRIRAEVAARGLNTPGSLVSGILDRVLPQVGEPLDLVARHLERAREALDALEALPGVPETPHQEIIERVARSGIRGEITRTLAVWKEKPWTRWAEDDIPTDLPPADDLPPLPADECPPGYAEPEGGAGDE